ncbi:MAG: preprotein translocase subunit SecG [Gemmobacter sp.]
MSDLEEWVCELTQRAVWRLVATPFRGGGVMTGRQAATALGKLTWAFAIAFIATSITLTILAAREAATSSVIDTIGVEGGDANGGAAPAAPALNDLLPPPVGGAPAPRAD